MYILQVGRLRLRSKYHGKEGQRNGGDGRRKHSETWDKHLAISDHKSFVPAFHEKLRTLNTRTTNPRKIEISTWMIFFIFFHFYYGLFQKSHQPERSTLGTFVDACFSALRSLNCVHIARSWSWKILLLLFIYFSFYLHAHKTMITKDEVAIARSGRAFLATFAFNLPSIWNSSSSLIITNWYLVQTEQLRSSRCGSSVLDALRRFSHELRRRWRLEHIF